MIINNLWKKIILDNNFYRKILNKKIEYKKIIVKTRNKNIILYNYLLNSIIKVYNGKNYIPIYVNDNKLGYRLKDFLSTINKKNNNFFLKNKIIKKCQK
uniref:Ribosomal protein S19 n=1 Tax=Babesia rodhaini TaxID=5870 RepID=A0A455R4S9_BABRO|nr:ribosomal protein S19 [Babesia rodhaini]